MHRANGYLLITLVFTLAGVGLGMVLDAPLLYGLLGFLLGRSIDLDVSLDLVERELARLRQATADDGDLGRAHSSFAETRKGEQAPHLLALIRRRTMQHDGAWAWPAYFSVV